MNYDLARQLSQQDFFQSGDGWALSVRDEDLNNEDAPMNRVSWCGLYVYHPEKYPNAVYEPTLSELIEALLHSGGYPAFELIYLSPNSDWKWRAHLCSKADSPYQFGDTPEEACARLWLALQE